MANPETKNTGVIPPQVLADLERAVQLARSGERAPEFEGRIHQEAARIREEVYRRHGLLDLGVPAIRELRDAE